MTTRGIIGAISFESLVSDPTLVLPVNQETTQKLLHILITELRRMRGDIADLQEATTPAEADPTTKTLVHGSVSIKSRTVTTGFYIIPGISLASAYTAGDAFGTKFVIPVPPAGIIHTACFLDKDDEGLETDLMICTKDFNGTADNAAFAITDSELDGFLSTITFATFKDLGTAQVSTAAALGLAYNAPDGKLYCQMVARGAPNIAANNIPSVYLTILADE